LKTFYNKVKTTTRKGGKKVGCNHNPTSQKGHRTTKKNNQNWINIYVLAFKAMAIMASFLFCIHMNVKEFKQKIHLMKF
jgi:hypothetical protein